MTLLPPKDTMYVGDECQWHWVPLASRPVKYIVSRTALRLTVVYALLKLTCDASGLLIRDIPT